MNNLPEINVSFEELNRIIMGPIRSKLLLTGIELKVFNRLSKPCSARDLAEVIDTHPENTRRFMDGLAACDLVLKKNGQYQNTPISQAFLVEGSDTYIVPERKPQILFSQFRPGTINILSLHPF